MNQLAFTHDLTIVPSWTDYEATAGEKDYQAGPWYGLWNRNPPNNQDEPFCLGAGSSWWETVLDVGTGSGVLSIASSFLALRKSLPMTWMM